MPVPALPFVKVAVACGAAAGVGDNFYQWARNLKYSKKKRKGREDSWDAHRSVKVASVAAAVGPILALPRMVGGLRWDNFAPALTGLAVAEACVVPVAYLWKEDFLFDFKCNIPTLLVSGAVGSLAGSAALAIPFGYVDRLEQVGQLGTFFPGSIVFTAGMGATAFFYYAFVNQTGLSMETKMNKDKDFLIVRAKAVGCVSAASLLGVSVLDIDQYPFAHLFLTDIVFMTGAMYQCFLTYIQSLHAERTKVEFTKSNSKSVDKNEVKTLRMRTMMNITMVGSSLLARPFGKSGHNSIAVGLQALACACWVSYYLTFKKEYGELHGDAGDWALVDTDDDAETVKKSVSSWGDNKQEDKTDDKKDDKQEDKQEDKKPAAKASKVTAVSKSESSSESELERKRKKKAKRSKKRVVSSESSDSSEYVQRKSKRSSKNRKKKQQISSESESSDEAPQSHRRRSNGGDQSGTQPAQQTGEAAHKSDSDAVVVGMKVKAPEVSEDEVVMGEISEEGI
uniref:CWH43-like N-terminal domain-containing protein n=1 Tax=Eutreptiella gymnastica TaxID=73025 RepID=A0A7S4GDI1_9EUGL|mmetsp:Transcript_11867/g.21765  ORF Transcript_11867/g.21765 Transcript_11867/m.21765 type:complete len:510 (+) Transcript_11867:37-1566(+)|eukprot:CAMPEP_0174282466 /NCGR_PEP_ID=MMETSP0809-20121228/2983_1 /TAXON_ID=73025 ORGANISM="Eutreptiella gymnastica-like, Strain CCMP1594" /NCGR_SAMPLE_ID=MMETSP0809 /ASSEMBLY_ACC=CAM_ASM_000658 /LENGTH=509 /DNA_ID=CAMNT_0015376695 /DNA_START=38 /DNA_END=1567 /DNA_ORIENTATION=-